MPRALPAVPRRSEAAGSANADKPRSGRVGAQQPATAPPAMRLSKLLRIDLVLQFFVTTVRKWTHDRGVGNAEDPGAFSPCDVRGSLGYRVDRVVLASWPRTKSSLDEGYVWEHIITAEDFELVKNVLAKTEVREAVAVEVNEGRMSIWDVPMTPSYEDCFYCPLFRPQAATDPTVTGCPGTAGK